MIKIRIFLLFFVFTSLYAVNVKYHGQVDLENGNFVEYDLKPSSFVKEIHFDSTNNYLITRLNQTYYHYCRINQIVVSNWVNSSSLGRFYNSEIKGNYDCRLGGIPQY